MHSRGVFTYSFFYNLQLNGKQSLQVSTHCVGKHHEIQFKYVDMAREGRFDQMAYTWLHPSIDYYPYGTARERTRIDRG